MLLDTHVWIGAANGGAKLGPKTRRRLEKSSGGIATTAFVSTVSVFEIVALHTAGRLRFNQPVERWVRETPCTAAPFPSSISIAMSRSTPVWRRRLRSPTP